jgi:WD40 repeat protein
VLFLRRNRTVVSGGSEPLIEGQKNYLRVWDPGSKIGNDDTTIAKAEYLSVVELSNGDLLSGSSEGILQHWRQGRPLGPPVQTGHGPIYALNLTGEGDLVSAGRDGMISIWQYGHQVLSFSTEQKGVTSLFILADRTLLSGGRDGSIKQWTAQGRRTNTPVIQTHHGAVWAIAQLQNNSALNCLHKINVLGGTSEKAYRAVNTRLITDQDPHGAYHAVAMAQSTSDLPFDVPTLVDIVIEQGEPALQLRLLKLFDSQPIAAEPIPKIRDSINQLGDKAVIAQLNQHLLNRQ